MNEGTRLSLGRFWQVFLDRVSFFHYNKHNVYNMWWVERSRPLGGRTYTYYNSTINIPPPLSRNAELLMTPQSIDDTSVY